MGLPKKFGKHYVTTNYKIILQNMTVVLHDDRKDYREEMEHLKQGDTAYFLDRMGKQYRKVVGSGVRAFAGLRELIHDIGEIFFTGFTFEGGFVKSRGIGREKIEDWSEIRDHLERFAKEFEEVFSKGKSGSAENRKEACKKMKEAVDNLRDVFGRISEELKP